MCGCKEGIGGKGLQCGGGSTPLGICHFTSCFNGKKSPPDSPPSCIPPLHTQTCVSQGFTHAFHNRLIQSNTGPAENWVRLSFSLSHSHSHSHSKAHNPLKAVFSLFHLFTIFLLFFKPTLQNPPDWAIPGVTGTPSRHSIERGIHVCTHRKGFNRMPFYIQEHPNHPSSIGFNDMDAQFQQRCVFVAQAQRQELLLH